MFGHDALGDRKPETVAVIHGAGAVDPVKALEHVFAFLRRERLAGRCYAQSAFVVPGLFQRYADRTGSGILDGIIQQDLRAMDATAVTICMENKIPVLAFGLFEENSIVRAVEGQDIGTLIV